MVYYGWCEWQMGKHCYMRNLSASPMKFLHVGSGQTQPWLQISKHRHSASHCHCCWLPPLFTFSAPKAFSKCLGTFQDALGLMEGSGGLAHLASAASLPPIPSIHPPEGGGLPRSWGLNTFESFAIRQYDACKASRIGRHFLECVQVTEPGGGGHGS